ncbi:MFS general substrate transporter [Basidiobolus meristosporus CBS 931.73]|uniref:MFS general substrate transporter n=1 Tax=Basidiobolus meristosporus CBS 931.73 TaxID=1314790 RepID=A0A1Y1VW05_9FUNG|nr:MFS general substrate transporter [Basidiobolus meristosporus CBS 931.73]ORY00057.1 MFS general substrate transporter [Basidiobolus meristosporus CBS 931.73]|eukprot:ORX65472.1 MFS general substrate transporter [Basidiobolus meristosporus CBS 931.73]
MYVDHLRLNSPLSQLVLVGIICCVMIGAYNSSYGIGTLGNLDRRGTTTVNTVFYVTCSLASIISGSLNNMLGPKLIFLIGCGTYIIYFLMIWFSSNAHDTLTIVGATFAGFGCAIIWTAQGVIMMAYPMENQKGRYFGIFWAIFNIGAFVGGLLTLCGVTSNVASVSFAVLTGISSLISLLLVNPATVVRNDGSRVTTKTQFQVHHELRQLPKTFMHKKLLLLCPLFFYSNWFYSYRFGSFNSELFTTRTRAFNSIFYWASQILGSLTFGQFLDNPLFTRPKRAVLGLYFLTFFYAATWLGCIFMERSRNEIKAHQGMDITENHYTGPLVLLLLCGISDSMIQTWCYWMLGAITNNAMILSRFSGFYKCIQAAGTAIAWSIALELQPLDLVLINCAIFFTGVPFAYFAARDITKANHFPVHTDDS